MGVCDLLPFLRKHAPAAFKPVNSAELPCLGIKRVAVDVPIFMYKYAYLKGTCSTAVLASCFEQLHTGLKKLKIDPVYVFDGAFLAAKEAESQRRFAEYQRSAQKASFLKSRVYELQEEGDAAIMAALGLCTNTSASASGIEQPSMQDHAQAQAQQQPILLAEEEDVLEAFGLAPSKPRIMSPQRRLMEAQSDLSVLEARLIKPTKAHYEAIREFLKGLGAIAVTAPDEAERYAAFLNKKGAVDAVLTNDTDALAFGAKKVLMKYGTREACIVDGAAVLEELDMDYETFVDFCIMCGCDFVSRIPNVGPAKAFKFLKDAKHGGSIEDVIAYRQEVKDRYFDPEVVAPFVEAFPRVRSIFLGHDYNPELC